MSMACEICERIQMIRAGTNPHIVQELETGFVVLGDHQYFRGYTLFLCKVCTPELHSLERAFRLRHLEEMALVAEAVHAAFQPQKLNLEQLGNGAPHLHWHIFPRRPGDTPAPGPVWWLPREIMYSDGCIPKPGERDAMIAQLRAALRNITQ